MVAGFELVTSRSRDNRFDHKVVTVFQVVPSDEDSMTFTVNFASGESYKLRAENAKERQARPTWV